MRRKKVPDLSLGIHDTSHWFDWSTPTPTVWSDTHSGLRPREYTLFVKFLAVVL